MASSSNENPVVRLQKLWLQLESLPGGTWLFSRLLAWFIPYTGTIGANIKILKPGFAKIQMRDRRRVRNHLRSIHALALANLGEYTSGLAMLGVLPANIRGIPTEISTEYFKKARGVLTAESHCAIPEITDDTDFKVFADIRNAEGEQVARTTVNWRLGPI